MRKFFCKSGFTLMEVLVALVILSIAFTSTFMSISSNAKNLLYLQNKTAASYVALNVIAEAQLQLINLASNNNSAQEAVMFNRKWQWNALIKQTENPAISTIEVSVKLLGSPTNVIRLIGYLRNNT